MTADPAIEDITDTGLAHEPGQEDRVFKVIASPLPGNEDGVYFVKVKTWVQDEHFTAETGRSDLQMQASLCDETGKALVTANGKPAVYPFPHTHTTLGEAQNIHEAIDAAQQDCAKRMITSILAASAATTARGVGPKPRSLS